MVGRMIVLPFTSTDTTAPKAAQYDPLESEGSILLVEPMHPHTQWTAGTPANLDTVPNIVAPILSTGASATMRIRGGILSGGKGALERSTKGGLHGIVSQAVALSSDDGMGIEVPEAFRAYVNANLGHQYYVSVWDRLTRALIDPAKYTVDYGLGGSRSSGIMSAAHNQWWGGNGAVAGQDVLGNTEGPRFASAVTNAAGITTIPSTTSTRTPCWGAPLNSDNAVRLSTVNQNFPSFVFYRLYVEDLTASGRTYNQVHALDYAMYLRHVLTDGGRYYGDTVPTDPDTIP